MTQKHFVSRKQYKRLDVCMAENLGVTRSFCSQIIREGSVLLNKYVVKKAATSVNEGDVLDVHLPENKDKVVLTPLDIGLRIEYENDWYAVVDKPAGLAVHPSDSDKSVSLVNAILYSLNKVARDGEEDTRPGIVHRLDKETSGVLLVAKTLEAKNKLQSLFKRRKISKKYICISVGDPIENIYDIENMVGRHPVVRYKMAVLKSGGRFAKSTVRVLKRFPGAFMAEVEIFTGRTHQIRVHMASLGFPVIGDSLYGGKKASAYLIERQALHAFSVSFFCPFEKRQMNFEAELPDDMQKLLGFLSTDNE